jgi:hypothetical protein
MIVSFFDRGRMRHEMPKGRPPIPVHPVFETGNLGEFEKSSEPDLWKTVGQNARAFIEKHVHTRPSENGGFGMTDLFQPTGHSATKIYLRFQFE